MAIEVECWVCGEALDEPGGILFDPPTQNGRTLKRHLCIVCHRELHQTMCNVRDLHRRSKSEATDG